MPRRASLQVRARSGFSPTRRAQRRGVRAGQAGPGGPKGDEIWYSRQWDNAPMPHSIFFIRDGHAIHGSHEVKNLGKPVSHGCVRISPQNVTTLYALVKETGLENTQVVLTGVTPGGEFKFSTQDNAI